jgi:general secretion pathway protein A
VYLAFYGLREKPFGATPDPRFLFPTESHREALAQLVYGVRERKGFIALTGEVGTGKTTLLHALLRRLDADTSVAFVFSSTLPFEGLLEYALGEWGVPVAGRTQADRLAALNAFLVEQRRAGRNTVLILDEAQNLEVPTLEQVRLLSNFESQTDKLLQILLVGQPELQAKLERPDLRQLKQRIGLRYRIVPLGRAEVGDYVRARLRIAGGRDPELFAPRAIERVAAYSGGIPRIVNTVCDHALLVGYAQQRRRIDAATVKEAIAYLEAGEKPHRNALRLRGRYGMPAAGWLRPPRWIVATLLLGVAVAAVGSAAAGAWTGGAPWRDVMAHLTDLADRARGALGL